MNFIIVTGMSGAGKSTVLNTLEDIGYYCSDNIPPQLIMHYAEILHDEKKDIHKIALVVDSKGMEIFESFQQSLDDLSAENYVYKLLFLDADNKVLLNRYKEGRRRHPLAKNDAYSLEGSINNERDLLNSVRDEADFIIDTSLISPSQLKTRIVDLFLEDERKGLTIICMSFGFKNGLPPEVDLVFDLRCLRNPFYVPELKERTGLESAVSDYVMDHQESLDFYGKIYDLVEFSLPLYIREGKSCLVIGMGCTGGKHRSVTFAERLAKQLIDSDYKVNIVHRDVNKINQY
ncbi:MAG: RNase adapter RapZ [Spirochaetaceae bacterium]